MKVWAVAAMTALCATPLFYAQAAANDVTFEKDVAPDEHLTGTVEVDDSSGDVLTVTGEASGAIKGSFKLDPVTIQAQISGTGGQLVVNFNRRDQVVTAHLDNCASPGNCTPGNPVPVWEKP